MIPGMYEFCTCITTYCVCTYTCTCTYMYVHVGVGVNVYAGFNHHMWQFHDIPKRLMRGEGGRRRKGEREGGGERERERGGREGANEGGRERGREGGREGWRARERERERERDANESNSLSSPSGPLGAGKTSLMLRYIYDTFEDKISRFVSEEKKSITVDGREVVLDIWDTAGKFKPCLNVVDPSWHVPFHY